MKDCEVDFMKAVIAIDSFKGSLSQVSLLWLLQLLACWQAAPRKMFL